MANEANTVYVLEAKTSKGAWVLHGFIWFPEKGQADRAARQAREDGLIDSGECRAVPFVRCADQL